MEDRALNVPALREVAAAAQEATGEWRLRTPTGYKGWRDGETGLYGKYGYVVRPGNHGGMFNDEAAATHVVTFDPPMVLALLDRLAAVEATLDSEVSA